MLKTWYGVAWWFSGIMRANRLQVMNIEDTEKLKWGFRTFFEVAKPKELHNAYDYYLTITGA